MDGSEIIKQIPTIAKSVGAVAASVPFTGIVKRMLGPAAVWETQAKISAVKFWRLP
jgi:hypothetical protein